MRATWFTETHYLLNDEAGGKVVTGL